MKGRENKEFEIRGINHLALVCKDMARTVEFYTQVLGMPLVKTRKRTQLRRTQSQDNMQPTMRPVHFTGQSHNCWVHFWWFF